MILVVFVCVCVGCGCVCVYIGECVFVVWHCPHRHNVGGVFGAAEGSLGVPGPHFSSSSSSWHLCSGMISFLDKPCPAGHSGEGVGPEKERQRAQSADRTQRWRTHLMKSCSAPQSEAMMEQQSVPFDLLLLHDKQLSRLPVHYTTMQVLYL